MHTMQVCRIANEELVSRHGYWHLVLYMCLSLTLSTCDVPQNITVSQNTSFFLSLVQFEGNMLYTLFLWIYINFSLNGHIKGKNGYFHKILKNNWDKQQIKFLIFGTFFCSMPVKWESWQGGLGKKGPQ
jgi:hypothetical protein